MPWLFMLVCFLAWAPGWGVISSLNLLLMETFNTDEISASQLGLLPLSTLTLGRLAVGFIGQLVSPGRLFYLYTATASIACTLVGWCDTPYATLGLLSVATFIFGATSSTFATYSIDLFGAERYNVSERTTSDRINDVMPRMVQVIIGFTLVAYGLSAMFATIMFALVNSHTFLRLLVGLSLIRCCFVVIVFHFYWT